MGRNESIRANAGRVRLLAVSLEWAGQTFTAVIQALCFIRGLDMQQFHPFFMTFITGSRLIHSSSLEAAACKASSLYSAHGGRELLTSSEAKLAEVPPKSLHASYPWYGMVGKAAYLAKALYALYKCPICCVNS